MKILIITNHSYMLYRFRKELIKRLMQEHEVVLSMPFAGHEDDFEQMGLECIETKVDRRGINPITDLKLFRTYREILRKQNPDMVLTYSIKPNIYAGLACSLAHIPYCAHVQGLGTAFQREPLASLVAFMYRIALRKVKTVFFENKANAEVFVNRHILKASSETILKGAGVDLEKFTYISYPDEREGVHFLFVGRIMREKGVNELFDAAKRLKEKYGERVVFDVVGFFEDDYKAAVEELVKDGIIRFHGFQENPCPYYEKAHCVVLPSYHEGMSNVLLEAAATGRALITTDIPGCREAVEEYKSGYLCKAGDADDLFDCFDEFLKLSPEKRKEMGISGRKKMEEEFNRNLVVEKTISAMFN